MGYAQRGVRAISERKRLTRILYDRCKNEETESALGERHSRSCIEFRQQGRRIGQNQQYSTGWHDKPLLGVVPNRFYVDSITVVMDCKSMGADVPSSQTAAK